MAVCEKCKFARVVVSLCVGSNRELVPSPSTSSWETTLVSGNGRFLYWSDRAIRSAAEDNGVELHGRQRWSVELNWKLLKAAVSSSDRLTRDRQEEARRLERALADAATEDLDAVPMGQFVKGVSTVSFARFTSPYANNETALLHTQTRSAHGRRVDLCLFGSMDNVRGFGHDDGFRAGWTSSAAPAIAELLATKGRQNTSQWDDEEQRAVEALKIALKQGSIGRDSQHAGRPETRGFTVGHAGDSQFVAEVYTDVLLTPERWNFHPSDPCHGAERIIVGRPLWVRSMSPSSVVRYNELRNGPGWARWWWLYRLQRRLHRPAGPVAGNVPAGGFPDNGEIPPRLPEPERRSTTPTAGP